VATASLSPADIATPIRTLLRHQFNATVHYGRVIGIDRKAKAVRLDDRSISYDYLVLATGARHDYFGRDEWEATAPGLKKIDDATAIRRRILIAFELAEACADDTERGALLTFVVVGAGPTGVELSGAIAELARQGMEQDFRRFDPSAARVILVQAGPRVLPTFPETLSARAKAALEKLGIEVRLNSRVSAVDEAGVMIGDERIAAHRAVGCRRRCFAGGQMAGRARRPRRPHQGPA
jgi:NADH dehydrogenase FAD-containing subunit